MNYPLDEIGLKNKIDELNARWEAACPDGFLSYGFYPYYTKQNYRILFVGREAHSMSYDDYIQVKYKDYINASGDTNGNFHRRIFYLAYGLLNNFPEFASIPWSSDIATDDFANGKLSFAFMNVSTKGNETGSTSTQWSEYDKSNKGGRSFRKEMIQILAPDIIVCANCGMDITSLADSSELLEGGQLVATEKLSFGSKPCLRFDTYHWSALRASDVGGLNDEDGFYNPLRDAFRKFRHLLK